MDGGTWASIVTQIPVVVVFVIFQLQWQDRQDRYNSRREAEWRQFIVDRDAAWAKEIQNLGLVIGELRDRIDEHDRKFDLWAAKGERRDGMWISNPST